MTNYLETIYFKDESGEKDYPQKLCNHLCETILGFHEGDTDDCPQLLDIGSGNGNYLLGFERNGIASFGFDKRKECVEILNHLKGIDEVIIKRGDIEKEPLPFDSNTFDIVFSKSVIEHIMNTDNFLSESYRVLKHGGTILILTPDWGTQHETFYDDYTHVKPWNRKGLQNAMIMHNFKNVDCRLFRQLPILWRYPWLTILANITSFLPHSKKWRDKRESIFQEWIRFSKEKMILATATK